MTINTKKKCFKLIFLEIFDLESFYPNASVLPILFSDSYNYRDLLNVKEVKNYIIWILENSLTCGSG